MISVLCCWLVASCSSETDSDSGETTNQRASALDTASGTGTRVVWVVMKQRASLAGVAAIADWNTRGQRVYGALTSAANTSQASLRAFLGQRKIKHRSFWAVNAVRIEADQATIDEVARRSDVEKIVEDATYHVPPVQAGEPTNGTLDVQWGLESIRAPQVWSEFGARGDGIVVANIDTGVAFDHPALARQYRGRLADGSVDHNYNWFDPTALCGPVPCDTVGHGTHTMGTMVGDDGDPGNNQIGVAPHASWIAAKGCEYDWCSSESLLAAAQWILAPTDVYGLNPDPARRPNVVNNSWGGMQGDPFFIEVVQAWIDAGIFPAFAAGNSGDMCDSVGSPGDYPETYAAGAYDIYDTIAWFSSRGPSLYGVTKPNIAAPGVDVLSSVPGGGYEWYSGTSMATPHLSGAVALMWSAAPSLVGDIEATRSVLDQTAIDTDDTSCGGVPENNNVWGEGRLDAYAAVELSPRGPTGILQGTVTGPDNTPIVGATLRIQGTRERTRTTDEAGFYSVRLDVGTYLVTASAFGFLSQTVVVDVLDGAVLVQDFQLAVAPTYSLSGTVRDGEGQPLAGVRVTLLSTPLPPAVTDTSGFYSLPGVPEGYYELSVAGDPCHEEFGQQLQVEADASLDFTLALRVDGFGYSCATVPYGYVPATTRLDMPQSSAEVTLPFPFTLYGQSYETATVTSLGYVNLAPSPWVMWGNMPIPDPQLPNGAIYAFWDELYMDGASGVYTELLGEAPNRQFVIEWRDLISVYSGERMTFEVLLTEAGAITMQYVTASSPLQQGDGATIGIENESGLVGFQYSYNRAVLSSEMAVRYSLPPSGTVEGTVSDANDGQPIGGATVQAFEGSNLVRSTQTTSHGFYRLQLPPGSYTVIASRDNYDPEQAPASVNIDQRIVQDFNLRTGIASLTPSTLGWVIPADQTRSRTLTLLNSGSRVLGFTVEEAGGMKQVVAASREYPRNQTFDPNARTTQGLFEDGVRPLGWTPDAAGDVLTSFVPQGLMLPWGVGYTGDLWLSDPPNMQNMEFTADGTPTGRQWWMSWYGEWPADMAYDASRNLMCQVNVGGDNGIYCWSQETGEVVEAITGDFQWTMTSQRGLAYRPDDDSFYIGGWNDGILYHIKGLSAPDRGSIISSCVPADGMISGLAYNQSMNVIWAATNSMTDTIYELDPDDCTVLGTLAHPARSEFTGAGLETDTLGNLWMISQNERTAYLVDSGVPAFSDVPWLSVSPASGAVDVGGSAGLVVTVNSEGLAPGAYLASVFVLTDAAKQSLLRVPVSLVVTAYQQAINAGGSAYVDSVGEPWGPDRKYTAGSFGYTNKSSVATTKKLIQGSLDQALYQNQRVNPYAYRFDAVPNGVYQLELQFAEFVANQRNGKRVFDVIIENTLVLPAHDIRYEVGSLAADAHTFFVEVMDGQVDVRLVPRAGADVPVINALRVSHRPDR